MNKNKAEAADPSARFDDIEQLLNSYPDISEEQLGELKHWFKKEASAFEVASIASKHPVGYAKFRAEHIDKFSALEKILGSVLLLILAFIVFFI